MKKFTMFSFYHALKATIIIPIIIAFFTYSAYSQTTITVPGTYATLQLATAAINAGTYTGNITISITNNVTETAMAQLNSGSTLPANWTSVTIKPTNAWTISAAHGSAIIFLNGASNVTIDGSMTVGGTTQDLTFNNSAISTSAYNSNFMIVQPNTYTSGGVISAYSGSNVVIKNVISYCNGLGAGTVGSIGILMDRMTSSTINNCQIKRSLIGIQCQLGNAVSITNSIIGNQASYSTDGIGVRGIVMFGTTNFIIQKNEVVGICNPNSVGASVRGIMLYADYSGGQGQGTYVPSGGWIDKNKIHFIRNSYASYCQGIMVQEFNTSTGSSYTDYNCTISNNYIFDISSTSSFGIGINLWIGNDVRIYHNTINMYLASGAVNGSYSSCIVNNLNNYANSQFYNIDCRNNIFRNNITNNSGGTIYDYIFYCPTAFTASSNNPFTSLDGNIYYNTSSYARMANNGGTFYTFDATGFSSWKTAVGSSFEGNSTISSAPAFIADDNLHIQGSNLTDLNFMCTPITPSGVWDGRDNDGELRRVAPGSGSTFVTFKGADEVRTSNLAISTPLTFNPVATTYCTGSNFTMNFNASVSIFQDGIARSITTSPIFSWYQNGTLVNGQANNSYIMNPLAQSNAGNFYARAKFAGDSVSTLTKALNIETAISITTPPPANSTVCSNLGILNLNLVAAGTINSYQWQKENPAGSGTYQNIVGQTTANLSITLAPASAATGNYRCQIFGPGNCGPATITSSVSNVSVADPLTNLVISCSNPTPSYVCTGSSLSFTSLVNGTIVSYQWQKSTDGGLNWNSVSKYPSQSQVLVMTNVQGTETGMYRCLMNGSISCVPSTTITNSISMTVYALYQITRQPSSINLCKGDQTFLVVKGNGITNAYHWQKDGVDISLTENNTAQDNSFWLQNATHTNSGVYRCRMTITDCRGIVDIYSDDAPIYISRSTAVTNQPITAIADIGQTASFQVGAQVIDDWRVNPKIPLSIQWYKVDAQNKIYPMVDNNFVAGSKSDYMTITGVTDIDLTFKYYVVVKGACGQDSSIKVSIAKPADINITTQPANLTGCQGTNLNFAVTAVPVGGTTLTYQWYFNNNKLSDGAFYTGSKTNQLTVIAPTGASAGQYFVDITVDNQKIKRSSVALLTLDTKPVLTTQPSATIAVATGKTLNLSVTATGSANLTYQWTKDAAPISGATNSTYSIAAVVSTDAGSYVCNVTDGCGTTSSNAAIVTISYYNQLNVTEPTNDVFVLGENTPNPFEESTKITFNLLKSTNVKVTVLDVLGNEVALLMNSAKTEGVHEITFSPALFNLTSGVYYCKMDAGNFSATRKMILVK
ncbi:MAG: immunoglobulin domain-containing protein [Candidatus Kapabacteria bacterium]|nr:immunoglobulin domain-containing protein [Candidatus Kapabacteria bacterium]